MTFVKHKTLRPLQVDFDTARKMTIEQKLLAGGILFDEECRIIKERIHDLLPKASEELVRDLLQLAIRRLHDSD